jgi:hypothetical protein
MKPKRRKPRFPYGKVTEERPLRILGLTIDKLATGDLEWMIRLSVRKHCIEAIESMEAIIHAHLARIANGR